MHVFLKTILNEMKMLIELSIYNKGRQQVLDRFDQVMQNKVQIVHYASPAYIAALSFDTFLNSSCCRYLILFPYFIDLSLYGWRTPSSYRWRTRRCLRLQGGWRREHSSQSELTTCMFSTVILSTLSYPTFTVSRHVQTI